MKKHIHIHYTEFNHPQCDECGCFICPQNGTSVTHIKEGILNFCSAGCQLNFTEDTEE